MAETDPASWMGPEPMIWAAELHPYKDKYYYFATFTNPEVKIGIFRGNEIERRACHVLVSDKAEGPYRPMEDKTYLPAEKPTLDGTLWVDTDGKPYMVYCYEWLQTWDGTIEKIELKPDLSGSMGEGQLLFRASDSPWSREVIDGDTVASKVTDGPYLFRTQTGRLGMIWTSWIYDVYTQGVAYSESGTLDGPWVQEEQPITPSNFGMACCSVRSTASCSCPSTATRTSTAISIAYPTSSRWTIPATRLSWRKNIGKPKTFIFSDKNQSPQNGKSISAERFFILSQMIFHSAEEFFMYTKPCNTFIYVLSE